MINFLAALDIYSLSQPVHVMPMTEVGRNNQMWTVEAGDTPYVLKQHTSSSYDDCASIDYEHRLLHQLAQGDLSFALPVPLLTREGPTVCQIDTEYFSLARRLPGERLNPSDQIADFGAALGELHTVLAGLPIESRPGQPLFAFPAPMHDVMNLTPQSLGVADEPPMRELLAWWQEEARALVLQPQLVK